MSLKQASSDNYPESTDVIITANGSKDLSRAAFRGGALVGYESENTRPPDDIPVEFVDWPFSKDDPSFQKHLEVVKNEKPRYAVAPDIEERSSLSKRLDQADLLAEYAEIVIVVPKGVRPSEIPSRFRVGIPAQEKFGGVPWPLWEYQDCDDVHILGGSPKRQQEISHHLQSVDSVDTTSPQMGAKFGDVWTGEVWEELNTNYYDRVERSMKNCLRMWNNGVDENRLRELRLKVDPPQPVCDEGSVTVASVSPLIEPPTREEMVVAPNEKAPHPGRGFFEQENAVTYRTWRAENVTLTL